MTAATLTRAPRSQAVVENLEDRRLLSAALAVGDEVPGTLVPTVFTAFPAAVVGGAKAKGASAIVTITNVAEAAYSGPVTVTLFASTDAALDTTVDPELVTVVKKLKLDSAESKSLRIKVSQFPSAPDGNYLVIARVSGDGVAAGTNASDDVVNIAAPFVDLSGAFATTPVTVAKGKKAKTAVTVNNSGNIDAKGTVAVAVALSTDPTGANPVSIATVNAKLVIKAGKSKALKLNFTVPAGTAPGAYFVVATLDSANAVAEKNEANNTILSSTALTIV